MPVTFKGIHHHSLMTWLGHKWYACYRYELNQLCFHVFTCLIDNHNGRKTFFFFQENITQIVRIEKSKQKPAHNYLKNIKSTIFLLGKFAGLLGVSQEMYWYNQKEIWEMKSDKTFSVTFILYYITLPSLVLLVAQIKVHLKQIPKAQQFHMAIWLSSGLWFPPPPFLHIRE